MAAEVAVAMVTVRHVERAFKASCIFSCYVDTPVMLLKMLALCPAGIKGNRTTRKHVTHFKFNYWFKHMQIWSFLLLYGNE